MSFKDYSSEPSGNTTIGDSTFIGPNMPRDKVRPALQQLAADGRELYDQMLARGDMATFIASGVGAIQRDWIDKSRETVSVLDFIPVNLHAGIAAGTETSDVTLYCQRALNSGKDVSFPNGTYMVDGNINNCLKPVSNQTIHLEAGASIRVIPNALSGYSAIRILDVENVVIEGFGEFVGERYAHTGNTNPVGGDEQGHGVDIRNSANITVRDLRFRDFQGDGVYVGAYNSATLFSSNVLIDNVTSTNNFRNGLSITACDGCVVRGGLFANQNGLIGAMMGVDVEPNSGKAPVTNVLIDGVTCVDNGGPGISISQPESNDIRVLNAYSARNEGNGLSVGFPGPGFSVVGGTFEDNTLNGITLFGQGPTAFTGPTVTGATVRNNTLDGVNVSGNLFRFKIVDCMVSLNGQHGIRCERTAGSYLDDGLVERNHVWNNSQTTDNTYDNIFVGTGCHYVAVRNNWVRANAITSFVASVTITPTNQPRYGINVTNAEINIVEFNDLLTAGKTANALTTPTTRVRGNFGYTPAGARDSETLIITISDETTALTAGTGKVAFRMPYAFILTGVKASLSTAQVGGSIFTVDVNESGTSILSTKLTIDNTEKTSATAATAAVISDAALASDAEITVDIDQIGDGTAKGLKVYLIGVKA